MNSVQEVVQHFRSQPKKLALWTIQEGEISFGELGEQIGRAQAALRSHGVQAGDSVLILEFPGPRLFASVIAVLGLGASCILVEPWMPISHIDHVVKKVKPKVFIANTFGRLWGVRVPSIRAIPHWTSGAKLLHGTGTLSGGVHAESIDAGMPAMIAFSSGTSGKPKGVVRSHGYLVDTHHILTSEAKDDQFPEPDLAVFPNIGLFHITTGRGALLVPHSWSARGLKKVAAAASKYRPATLSCGPAFLLKLFEQPGFESLRTLYVGGALTDCWIFEKAFERWKNSRITHIYGGTEAEPVSYGDARTAVRESQARGFFQTLQLGSPIGAIRYQLGDEGAWVAGGNVCGEYVGTGAENDVDENKLFKRRDVDGTLWHFMGDRLRKESSGTSPTFWYEGRSFQKREDFMLEQSVYSLLQSSRSFLVRRPAGEVGGELWLAGEGVSRRAAEIRRQFPLIQAVKEISIVRDRRHRARIDRARSLKKGGLS